MCLAPAGIVLMLLAAAPAAEPAATPWAALVVGRQTEPERLATIDLQRYLAEVTGVVPELLSAADLAAAPRPAVVLGTPRGNALVAAQGLDAAQLGEQGYLLGERLVAGQRLVLAAGAEPEGAVNAIYGLLWELGYAFRLGSEDVPERLPAGLGADLVRRPALAVRGVLPWYNFLNSPTSWDPVDHRALVDALVRQGANFVGFHSYDNEPFAAYEEEGRLVGAARLLNTSARVWGTWPMATADFAGGTGRFYADEHFGAATTQIGDDQQALRAEQGVMRDALAYARRRGVRTCLGFEVSGDPLDPAVRDRFLARLERLLATYPGLDYVWLWQSETQGAQGFWTTYNLHILGYTLDPASPLVIQGMARRGVFRRIVEREAGARPYFQATEAGALARAIEGARLEQFGWLAWRQLQRVAAAPRPRLVLSGWGGDERLLSAEYAEGLDRLLPGDVVFSSLDNITPGGRVDTVYGELPGERERWPIPWLENDGDQWHPQPYVHLYQPLMRNVLGSGSQGVLGIHWRTREIEENLAYLVRAAWQPDVTAAAFFEQDARRSYDAGIAAEMAALHGDLDKLGYRWAGGSGQNECAVFSWGAADAAKLEALRALRERAAALLPRAGRGTPRLNWLLRRIEWVLAYADVQTAVQTAEEQMFEARHAEGEAARAHAAAALAALDEGLLARALRAYSLRVTTRGEYGVLATINAKAVVAWREQQAAAEALSGRQAEPPPEWHPEPEVILPRRLTTAPAGEPLTVDVVVVGGGPATARYRPLAAPAAGWTSRQLAPVAGWVQRVVVPAEQVQPPGLALSFDPPLRTGPDLLAITVLPPGAAPALLDAPPPPLVEPLELSVDLTTEVPVTLSWAPTPGADWFEVLRDDQPLGHTAAPFYADAPTAPLATYRVEAVRDGQQVAGSKPVAVRLPRRAPDRAPDLSALVNRGGVLLSWPPPRSLFVSHLRLERLDQAGAVTPVAIVPAMRLEEQSVRDQPPPGRWTYRLVPLAADGTPGAPSEVTATFPPPAPPPPALALPLTAPVDGATVTGDVRYGLEGLRLGAGHLSLPHREAYDLGQGLTLDFTVRADRVDAMPVLLCHGAWQVDGWFVQILDRRLIVRLPAGDALGPPVEPGRTYAVRFVFDGERVHLRLDGAWLPQSRERLRPRPARRPLVIGQYDSPRADYQFWGVLRDLRLVNDVLLDD